MWNQKEFEKKAGLGKVVASNYFVSKWCPWLILE
jgi:hypothetical protein